MYHLPREITDNWTLLFEKEVSRHSEGTFNVDTVHVRKKTVTPWKKTVTVNMYHLPREATDNSILLFEKEAYRHNEGTFNVDSTARLYEKDSHSMKK